jgi:O-antigen ligase
MSFLYPFMTFLQPGIAWPQLAPMKPIILMSVLGLLAGWTRRSTYPRKQAFFNRAFIWLLVFLFAQFLSLLPHGLSIAVEGLSYWSNYFGFVAISLLLITDERTLARYVWGMMVGSMVIVVVGILAVVYHWTDAVGGRAGAYGMYENHNDYSFIIIQILPFLFMYAKIGAGFFRRTILAAALILCVVGILLSLSRGGMLALVLEFILIVLIGMTGRKRMILLPIMVAIGIAAIGYQWAQRSENQGSGYTAEDAQDMRFELWRAAIKMAIANPLLGVGSGMFSEYADEYSDLSHDVRGKVSHNTYLEVLTGSGMIGFYAFCAMILTLIRMLRRPIRAQGPPILDATRKATLIAIYSILFRAVLDAKPRDWSFYVLCTIGIAYAALQRRVEIEAEKKAKMNPEAPVPMATNSASEMLPVPDRRQRGS